MIYRPPGTSVFVVNIHVGKGEASNPYKLDVQVSLLLPMSQASTWDWHARLGLHGHRIRRFLASVDQPIHLACWVSCLSYPCALQKKPMAAFQLEDVQHSRGTAGTRKMPANKQLHERNRATKQPTKQKWEPQKVKVLQQKRVRSTIVEPGSSLLMSRSDKRTEKQPTKDEAIPHRTRAEGGRKRRKK